MYLLVSKSGQRVAAVGRRVNTLCQGEDSVQQQLVLFQTYHNFVLPHTSLRQALLIPETTNGTGSVRVWRPCTPAMATRMVSLAPITLPDDLVPAMVNVAPAAQRDCFKNVRREERLAMAGSYGQGWGGT